MNDGGLKPCPFCGGEAKFGQCMTCGAKGWCVKCVACGARSVPIYEDCPVLTSNGLDESTRYDEQQAKAKVAERWNRRAE